MKIVNSTKVSKRVQEKIPHVPYIVNKNGKPLKVKGKITYEKLMNFSNGFGENIEKYKKVPTPRPHDSIRMKRPFGPLDNKSLKNNFGRPAKVGENKKILKCRKFGRPASVKESKALLRPCKRKFGKPSLGKIMSKNDVGYRKPIIKPGDTISISSTGGRIKVKKES